MNAFEGLRRFFRLPAAESRALELIDDEIDFHLACRTERLVAEGIPAAEARQ